MTMDTKLPEGTTVPLAPVRIRAYGKNAPMMYFEDNVENTRIQVKLFGKVFYIDRDKIWLIDIDHQRQEEGH